MAAALFLAPLGTTSTSAAVRFWFHDRPTFRIVGLDGEDASVPEHPKRGFARGQELLGLGAAAPPHDVGLDGVDFLEGPVEVEGVEFVGCHAISQQCDLQHARRRPFVEGALARIGRGIEKIGPGLGFLAAQGVLVEAQDKGMMRSFRRIDPSQSVDRDRPS